MDEGDLLRGHPAPDQLAANVLINVGKRRFFLGQGFLVRGAPGGRGHVTEDKLGQLIGLALAPVFQDVLHAEVDLCSGLVGKQRVNQTLIQSELAPVRGDLQHIVLFRVNRTVVDLGSPFRKSFYEFLLNVRGLGYDVVVFDLRRRKVELVGGFYVRDLPEEGHELRQIEELSKPRPRPVARSLRGQLQGGCGLSEPGGPAVEVAHSHLLEPVVLQVAVDGVHLRHGVGDRGAGRKDHAAVVCQLVQITALVEQVRGFLRVGGGQARDVSHLRVEEQVFVIVAFINKEPVYTQLFKGYDVILLFGALELLQLGLQAFLRLFELLDGEPVAARRADLL